jgi:hypothetical protein
MVGCGVGNSRLIKRVWSLSRRGMPVWVQGACSSQNPTSLANRYAPLRELQSICRFTARFGCMKHTGRHFLFNNRPHLEIGDVLDRGLPSLLSMGSQQYAWQFPILHRMRLLRTWLMTGLGVRTLLRVCVISQREIWGRNKKGWLMFRFIPRLWPWRGCCRP